MKDLTARIDALLATAAKATSGKWRLHDAERATIVAGKPGGEVANCCNGFGDQDANATHIAAVNPADLTALLLDCKAALATARNDALEEAALLADKRGRIMSKIAFNGNFATATAIRTLKEPKP